MLIGDMVIHGTDEHTAILMTYPDGNCGKINSTHHSMADEVVTAVVKPERVSGRCFALLPQPHSLTSFNQRFLKAPCRLSLPVALRQTAIHRKDDCPSSQVTTLPALR